MRKEALNFVKSKEGKMGEFELKKMERKMK